MQEFLKNTVLFILILVLVIELFKISDLSYRLNNRTRNTNERSQLVASP